MNSASDIPAHKFHEAMRVAGIEYSALSWRGFNLFGDLKSINEARRLLYLAGTVSELRAALIEARKASIKGDEGER